MTRSLCIPVVFAAMTAVSAAAQNKPSEPVVVFEQSGFPTIGSEPIPHATLLAALGPTATFADLAQMKAGDVLKGASLLVLPYGSAVPTAAWPAVQQYLQGGGNLLLLGGQPLRVPVLGEGTGPFTPEQAQDSYSRTLGFLHSYPVPTLGGEARFHWRHGYEFLPAVEIKAQQIYAVEGRLNGLGYLDSGDGTHLAAPVIAADRGYGPMQGARIVALPFKPATGYWASTDAIKLVAACAHYAEAGATALMLESQYAAIRPGELPELSVHLHGAMHGVKRKANDAPESPGTAGHLHAELRSGAKVLDSADLALRAGDSATLPFRKPLPRGVYTVRATWTPDGDKIPGEFAENGFIVEDLSALGSGQALGTHADFITRGDKPFFPVGANYFSTEANGWDFSGPRNDAVWERDFADMERHGVNFVRTGVWGSYGKFIEPATGAVNERFLRNLEGFLAAAQSHSIAVNFTFFAFSPHTDNNQPKQGGDPNAGVAPANPYLDPTTLQSEHGYVQSVVNRFGKLPFLSYDLINEPSFSNPRLIFKGNVPNNDPAELSAWHTWLSKHYASLDALADAWRSTPGELKSFDSVPLPKTSDLNYDRYGNPMEVRAFDYNLFAQDMFSGWVHGMVDTIRNAGSAQLINVGQDEGGVTSRLLNQFYATAGVSFTTNHTYWQDDALLWDSVAAKRPGLPNITGETGYQPAWDADGAWRYDEVTGLAIEERKWVLGFAAGSSGALMWDWDREVDFGMERSDGSAKVWEKMMGELGEFAKQAAPYATALQLPQTAIVLPEPLQLSVFNSQALEAQQSAVRVLYQYNRREAYAVGSYMTDTLGTPKLILLPSPYGLNDKAWSDIEARVREGATLLVTGPFNGDEHMHPTGRAEALGVPYTSAGLQEREQTLHLPSGPLPLQYGGMKTTVLDRAFFANGKDWAEVPLGKGRVLVSAQPIELNSNLESIAAVYAYALGKAGVDATYTTDIKDPGILICPTRLPNATLYAITSETAATDVRFHDERSGKSFAGHLDAGRAALLLVGTDGKVLATYNWR